MKKKEMLGMVDKIRDDLSGTACELMKLNSKMSTLADNLYVSGLELGGLAMLLISIIMKK